MTKLRTCKTCRSWNGCPGFTWYSWQDFKYCRMQILWFLENLETLESGKWPAEPVESGYLDQPIVTRRVRAEGSFAKAAGMAGDITAKLDRTGKDGRWLLWAIQHKVDYRDLSQECLDALNYISGWECKRQGYAQWLADRKDYRLHRTKPH